MGTIVKGAVLKGRYRLESVLGRGGMASVWRGHDEVLDRPVAIKVLSDTIASDPDFRARFRREATVAAALSHPNLAGVYDYSESDERPYLVMEFVAGETLGSLIEHGTRIDREKLARELLGAVAGIHAAGIIHRDIKPHNIMLEGDRTAKLIDFGIALPRDATSLTQTGLILATKRYAAPEVMEGSPADERSDLYSCGVVLRACPGEGSLALESLVTRLTRGDRGSRPGSAREALALLDEQAEQGRPTEAFIPPFEVSASHGRTEELTQRQVTRPVPARSVGRRKRWAAVAAILGVAAAVAVAFVVAGGSGDESAGTAAATKGGGGEAGKAAEGKAAAPASAGAEETTTGETASVEEGTSAPLGTEPDPALGSALNQEGFELIQAGSYQEAIPILEQAVSAFPVGSEETDYAYALFNLGSALRLSGRPAEAIPILEQRLTIPNQTDVVRRELITARSEAAEPK